MHGVGATARTRAGDREFGPAAAIDYDDVVLDWMDRHLRGVGAGTADTAPVRYFVMGADTWKTAASWPPPASPVAYVLTAAGPRRPGTLTPASQAAPDAPSPGRRAASTFVSDPDAPVENPFDTAGAHDYRALVDRPDVLTFDSAPLETDTEVTGPVSVELQLSCDCGTRTSGPGSTTSRRTARPST